MTVGLAYYLDLLRPVFADRTWILANHVLAWSSALATSLERLGARPCFAIATSRGIGTVRGDLAHVVLPSAASSLMEGMRAADRIFDELPATAVAAIAAHDPDGTARAIRGMLAPARPIAGRAVYGGRRPAWIALEDKTIIDRFWDAAGVARAPARVVDLGDERGLRDAAAELDHGRGTVWAGDNRSGVHGVASFVRWVRGPEAIAEARAFLAGACDRARIMPFLDGIPCSIHGIVFPDTVVALRPCEMIVLRQPGGSRFLYASAGTFWDPPPADREVMRETVRRVGRHLRDTVGFRGMFTVDGVLTERGFLPTELNPRFGAAIDVVAGDGLPMYLLNLAIIEEDLDWRPHELERLLVERADARRSGKLGIVVPGVAAAASEELRFDGDGLRRARDGEPSDLTLTIGPSTGGSYVSATLREDRTPVGPSLGPRALAVLAYVHRTHGLGYPALEAAAACR